MFRVIEFALIVLLATTSVWGASTGGKHGDEGSGHGSRHKRQGAGLHVPASYIVPGGDGSGSWGDWGEVSSCSRTCGGGVASQKRICLKVESDGKSLCTGGDTKYFSCQTQDCPPGTPDFKAQQCSEHDQELFSGKKYKWLPMMEVPNPCQLNCKPESEHWYMSHGQVTDGTRCGDLAFYVCVNGNCELVGCDMMLGSDAREDECGVCRGNNTSTRYCPTAVARFRPRPQFRSVQEVCAMPTVTGDCADYTQKWYHDIAGKRCHQFNYSGCGGNGNNFNSEEECEARCKEPDDSAR